MVILITGASHTGKTLLAQRLLEACGYPYLSVDHLKMGLIRSGYTPLTPEDDDALTGYLWPILREMVKTAIENRQNLIVEGCYIPAAWRRDFDDAYLPHIRFVCLAMTEDYIDARFEAILAHGNDIEQRLYEPTFTAETFALLPRLFGVKPGDMIEMTVRTPQEAEEASVQAAAFCKAHGESPRNSMLLSLCVEEMVNNIVAHGFKADRTDQCVDVRILFKDGQRIIRIRDNCVNFDPVEYLKLHESDDPSAHIGIRMVMKMVKSANYVNSLGLNNLTLVL